MPVSPHVQALRAVLDGPSKSRLHRVRLGSYDVDFVQGHDSLWALLRADSGGLAMRLCYETGPFTAAVTGTADDRVATVRVDSLAGQTVVSVVTGTADGLPTMRVTTRFTPSEQSLVPFVPRDLYPFDDGDPSLAKGVVKAAQRGLNGGLLFFSVDEPDLGNLLYLQNFTALNDYFRATRTSPDGAVGGEWPELGFLLPTPPQSATPPINPLKPGVTVTLSDATLVLAGPSGGNERTDAAAFLRALAAAYPNLDRPDVEWRDWVGRAEKTLRDLDKAPEATIRHYGERFIHPYVAAEYPDIMVQSSVVQAISQWGSWLGKPHPLEEQFKAGLTRFYDPKLKTLRRYLPNVGKDKNADAVDSWYLYHPLVNLGKLALAGDTKARSLLLKSLDFGIKAARHFRYEWPVQYDIEDFSVITEDAGDSGRGQTDVGGVYAWVMLQAFELTAEESYLQEAKAAIDATKGLKFDLNYQANLTAWGAAACMRLWRLTGTPFYREQADVFLASFFHNCELWESEIEHAAHYRNFLGATALHDGHYMAIYECFDSFSALEHYLEDAGDDVTDAARMLVTEYGRYALDRAWFYYPDALPKEALAPKQRENNGHLVRRLSFPVEDLYADGQQAGQVGQEVYGCGAGFVFATRSFHRLGDAPFHFYSDVFLDAKVEAPGNASVKLKGVSTCTALVAIVRRKRRKLPKVRLHCGEEPLRGRRIDDDRIEFRVPADSRLLISWD